MARRKDFQSIVNAGTLGWEGAGSVQKAIIFEVKPSSEPDEVILVKAFDNVAQAAINVDKETLERKYVPVTHIIDKRELVAEVSGDVIPAYITTEDTLIEGSGTNFSVSAGVALIKDPRGHEGNMGVLGDQKFVPVMYVSVPDAKKPFP